MSREGISSEPLTPEAVATRGTVPEVGLDPDDWPGFRALAHRMLDDTLDAMEHVRDRAPWRPFPADAARALRRPLPRQPSDASEVYEEFRALIEPYAYGNTHPRFWGWVNGTGTPVTVLAELLAAGMNPNTAAFDQSAVHVESVVLAWLREALGLPAGGSGLLVSGGSMANLLGLAVGRHARAPFDVRDEGLAEQAPLVVYASTETHSSVQKAVELMGLGARGLHKIPVDADYRVDVAALRAAVRADRARGLEPLAVVGNCGTVNTGALDDLAALADLCAEEGLWFHVDGAFGSFAALSPALRPLVRGLERADSLACDLHKWMYMPFEAGCLLVRHAAVHRDTFTVIPAYLQKVSGGVAGVPEELRFSDLGIQLTRGFRALKVWFGLRTAGLERHARLVEQNVAQAAHLVELVEASDELELVAPAPLNVVNFRYRAPGLAASELDRLNERLLVRLQEDGVAVPSSTVLGGRFCVRVAITNHRTRRDDLDALVAGAVAIGRELAAELRAAPASVG
jgi:glutamate/tyrosine decarboxylase-like PLP-dependent enzyme